MSSVDTDDKEDNVSVFCGQLGRLRPDGFLTDGRQRFGSVEKISIARQRGFFCGLTKDIQKNRKRGFFQGLRRHFRAVGQIFGSRTGRATLTALNVGVD
jgi:hypothetical protein